MAEIEWIGLLRVGHVSILCGNSSSHSRIRTQIFAALQIKSC
jgi:hypothetical protein